MIILNLGTANRVWLKVDGQIFRLTEEAVKIHLAA
jgi:hypothetical protein